MRFKTKKPHYEYLRKRWSARHRTIQTKFWDQHKQALAKHLALGSLGGLLLLTAHQHPALSPPPLLVSRDDVLKGFDQNVLLAQALLEKIPKEIRPLYPQEESAVISILNKYLGLPITAQINGISLNRNYGLIGGEQHLYRYPGDNLYAHAQTAVDYAKYGGAGIAPQLGAWGYFALTKEEFSQIDKMRERYYLAIQTFKIAGYAENVDNLRDFFKYRKMLVVNPKTGQSVVATVADAGPSEWTGKHLGGSPEVMDVLGLGVGLRKGAVLYFFVDDPKDEIPLGPIKVKDQA